MVEMYNVIEEFLFEVVIVVLGVGLGGCMSCYLGLKRKWLIYKVLGFLGGVGFVCKIWWGIVIVLFDLLVLVYVVWFIG